MMKKQYAVLILAAVLLFTCSCGKAPSGAPSGWNTSDSLPFPSRSIEPEAEAFPISEIVSEEGSFTDEWGEECSYSYHVPQLDADTPDAAYINDEIYAIYGSIVATCNESIEKKIMPDYASIDWESYQNGSIVSIVLKTITYYGHWEDYSVFNYDAKSGIELFTPDIFAIKNISEDRYFNELRRTVIQYFDDANFDTFTEWNDLYRSDYAKKRGWTCSDKTIVDRQMTYLDANGDIVAIVPVGYFAEVDYIYQVFTVDLAEDPAAKIEDNYFSLFSAKLENGELTVLFLGESETAPESYRGDPYTVHGLYSDYTQLRCGTMGGIGDAFVFLLTDDGKVEFVDVNKGINYGYLCGSGPILGVQNIVSLETSMTDNGFETVVAVGSNGERIDLAPFVQAHEQSISDDLLTNWFTYITYETDGGGSYEDFCSLEISSWDQARLEMINSDAGTEFDYTGSFTFLGISEAGSVYAYCFADEEGKIVYEGAASLLFESSEGINGFADNLYLKDWSGTGIFTKTASEEVIFTKMLE